MEAINIANVLLNPFIKLNIFKNKQLSKAFFILPGFVKNKVINKLDPARFYLTLDFEEPNQSAFLSNLELTNLLKNEDTLSSFYDVNDFKINDFFYCVFYQTNKKKLRCIPLIFLNYDFCIFLFSRFNFNHMFLSHQYFRELTIFFRFKYAYNFIRNRKQKFFYFCRQFLSSLKNLYVNFIFVQNFAYCINSLFIYTKFCILYMQKRFVFIKQILMLNFDFLSCIHSFFLVFINFYIKTLMNKSLNFLTKNVMRFVANKCFLSSLSVTTVNMFYRKKWCIRQNVLVPLFKGWRLSVFDRYLLWRVLPVIQRNILYLSKSVKARALFNNFSFSFFFQFYFKPYVNIYLLNCFLNYNLLTVLEIFFFIFNLSCVLFFFCNFVFNFVLIKKLFVKINFFYFFMCKKKNKQIYQKHILSTFLIVF